MYHVFAMYVALWGKLLPWIPFFHLHSNSLGTSPRLTLLKLASTVVWPWLLPQFFNDGSSTSTWEIDTSTVGTFGDRSGTSFPFLFQESVKLLTKFAYYLLWSSSLVFICNLSWPNPGGIHPTDSFHEQRTIAGCDYGLMPGICASVPDSRL